MTPENPVVGGTVLRIPAIQSPNFNQTAGTGWAIFQNGTAFFYSVTAEGIITAGTFQGNDFLINSAGAFFYSGTPAAGNLIGTIANNGGADTFNNSYLPGQVTYDNGARRAVQMAGGAVTFYDFTPQPLATFTTIGLASGNFGTIPAVSGEHGVLVEQYLFLTDGTNNAAFYFDGTGRVNLYNAPFVSTAGTAANPSVLSTDTWHAMSLLNGWANTGAYVAAKYRLVASPPNSVEVIGMINAAAASSATFFTLPSGYIPASQQPVSGAGETGNVPAGLSPWVRCDTSGNLNVENTGAVPNAFMIPFHGFISLDA